MCEKKTVCYDCITGILHIQTTKSVDFILLNALLPPHINSPAPSLPLHMSPTH